MTTLFADAPPLLNTAEAAELLRLSKRTIRRKYAEGLLPGYRSHPGRGGRMVFKRADVLALVGIVEEQEIEKPRSKARGRR
jgi:excisionase family DNA binding protein